ncbi:MAG: response regulator [Anaerolineae bacterium]|nr:response regulator [Anaerolineae bacterium]
MLANQLALVMLVSGDKSEWVGASLPEACEVNPYNDIRDAVRTLQNIRYDLIILDDALFKGKAIPLVNELKRRYPYIPLMVITDSNDSTYQDQLTQAGADDCITEKLPKKQFQFHVNMLLKQHDRNQALVRLNHNLHLMASLSQLLYSTSDPYTLILQAIKFIRAAFQLYGMAFILKEGEVYRMYAGGEEVVSKNKLYESIMRPEEYDPFLWTVRNKAIQIYANIGKHAHYRTIPILNRAESVAIIPLTYQYETLGAMAIFAAPGTRLTHEDVIVYERYGAQLISALQNANQHREQRVNIQSSQQLLRAWQLFAGQNAPDEIAATLCDLLEEVPHISHAFVWFDEDDRGMHPEILADTKNNQIIQQYDGLRKRGMIGAIVQSFSDGAQPAIIDVETAQDAALVTLAKTLPVRRLVTLPITSGGRPVGGVIAGITDETNISSDELGQMAALCYIAGQAMERIVLTSAVTDRNNRMEAILRSVAEGIFFVDDSGKVSFVNPQVTELTQVGVHKVMQQDVEVLFNELATGTKNPQMTLAQLQAGKAAVFSPDYRDEEYPIIELELTAADGDISLEFVKIEGINNRKIAWAGVLRNEVAAGSAPSSFQSMVLNTMSENLRIPYAQLRSLISTLSEQHGHFAYRERDQLLRQIEENFERFGGLWSNFLEIQGLELGDIALQREPANIYELMLRVVNGRTVSRYQRQIHLEVIQNLPALKLDEFRIEQALSDVILFALDAAGGKGEITVRVEQSGEDIRVIFKNDISLIGPDQAERIFEPFFSLDGKIIRGLYTSRELVRRHGGHTWAEPTGQRGLTINVVLPSVAALSRQSAEQKLPPISPVDTALLAAEPPTGRPSRAPSRSLSTIMMLEGSSSLTRVLSSKLQDEKYDVLVYRTGEEAIEDLNTVRIDLIIIDMSVDNNAGLDICRRIRQRSEAPIVLVADKATEAERVEGLRNAGADDYLSRPISDEEMMAKIQVIFKRKDLPDRMSEPLVAGDLYVDFARRQVFLSNKPIDLTRIEYDLLYHLVINKGQVLTHKQLLEKVWGPDYGGETHYLWVNISRLRNKLKSKQPGTQYIHTQQGIGYFFDA